MDKKALGRRALFTLALVAVTGRAFASDDEGHAGGPSRGRHRGYKVGGMVLLVIGVIIGSMGLFGEFRRNRAGDPPEPLPPPPPPLPEGADWDSPHLEESKAPAQGPRARRTSNVGR